MGVFLVSTAYAERKICVSLEEGTKAIEFVNEAPWDVVQKLAAAAITAEEKKKKVCAEDSDDSCKGKALDANCSCYNEIQHICYVDESRDDANPLCYCGETKYKCSPVR